MENPKIYEQVFANNADFVYTVIKTNECLSGIFPVRSA